MTSTERKKAASKSLLDRFFKIKSEAPPPKLEDLADRKAEALQMVDFLKAPADMKVKQGAGMAAALDGLAEFDLFLQTGSGRKIFAAGIALKSKVGDLTDHRLPELFKVDQAIKNATTGEQLAAALDTFVTVETKFLNTMAAIAVELENIGAGTQDMLQDEAVKAWVKENPDQYQRYVEWALGLVDTGLAIAAELTPPQFKMIPTVLQALKPAFDKAVLSADARRQIDNYNKEHIKTDIFEYHNENPLSIATMLVEKHKKNVAMVLSIVGIGGGYIPGWTFIKGGLQKAADVYFDQKLQLAKDALEGVPPTTWKDVANTLFADLKEGLEEALMDVVDSGKIPNEKMLKEEGINLLKNMLRSLVREIVKVLPIEPAQAVTGDTLIAEVEKFATAGILTMYHQAGQAQQADYVTPTADADGRAIETILSTRKLRDDAGDFLWVRIEGVVGKLHLDGLAFIAEDNGELAKIPTEDNRGRKIDEVRDGMEGTNYLVRIGIAWGLLDPATRRFTATRIDDNEYADWSKRRITDTGYVEEDGTEVIGKWYRWGNKPVFMFWNDGDNSKEWAHGSALTGVVQGSTKYNIMNLIGDRAKPLTLQL